MPALNLEALLAELDANESVDNSAVVAITRLLDEIAQNSGNQAAIDGVVARWRDSTARVAAAVANVPA
jgi:hypothetical protein